MFRKLIRKKHFRTLFAQLRGAKILREQDTPFFVVDTVSGLTDVPLGLQENDFPKVLVGSHRRIAEILLRQIFLKNYLKICSAVMQSIGSGKPISLPLTSAWRKHLKDNGVPSSAFYCRVLLFFSTLRQIAAGFVKSLILISPVKKPRYPGCPYVAFTNLSQQDLPINGDGKSYDIISWYKESIIRKPKIGKIWAQAKVKKEYVAPSDLIVTQSIFPKLGSFSRYVRFIFRNTFALLVAVFGVFMGKWWYGFLYHESVFYNYLCSLNNDHIADDYFFSVSSWLYKPLWTFEAEQKGSDVSLYCYSTNMEKIWRKEKKELDTYGLNIMLWNHFIIWDEQQKAYFKKYRPRAVFTLVGYISQTGLVYRHTPKNNKKILSIFDVTPWRSIKYTSLGYAIAPYSEEMNLSFLEDIIEVFKDSSWEILWKEKRIVDSNFISNAFIRKRLDLVGGRVKIIDVTTAASSIIEASDAVISMPFTSTSIIAKVKGVNTIFYDTSEGYLTGTKSRGIPILKSKLELNKWLKSLSDNHPVVSYD